MIWVDVELKLIFIVVSTYTELVDQIFKFDLEWSWFVIKILVILTESKVGDSSSALVCLNSLISLEKRIRILQDLNLDIVKSFSLIVLIPSKPI